MKDGHHGDTQVSAQALDHKQVLILAKGQLKVEVQRNQGVKPTEKLRIITPGTQGLNKQQFQGTKGETVQKTRKTELEDQLQTKASGRDQLLKGWQYSIPTEYTLKYEEEKRQGMQLKGQIQSNVQWSQKAKQGQRVGRNSHDSQNMQIMDGQQIKDLEKHQLLEKVQEHQAIKLGEQVGIKVLENDQLREKVRENQGMGLKTEESGKDQLLKEIPVNQGMKIKNQLQTEEPNKRDNLLKIVRENQKVKLDGQCSTRSEGQKIDLVKQLRSNVQKIIKTKLKNQIRIETRENQEKNTENIVSLLWTRMPTSESAESNKGRSESKKGLFSRSKRKSKLPSTSESGSKSDNTFVKGMKKVFSSLNCFRGKKRSKPGDTLEPSHPDKSSSTVHTPEDYHTTHPDSLSPAQTPTPQRSGLRPPGHRPSTTHPDSLPSAQTPTPQRSGLRPPGHRPSTTDPDMHHDDSQSPRRPMSPINFKQLEWSPQEQSDFLAAVDCHFGEHEEEKDAFLADIKRLFGAQCPRPDNTPVSGNNESGQRALSADEESEFLALVYGYFGDRANEKNACLADIERLLQKRDPREDSTETPDVPTLPPKFPSSVKPPPPPPLPTKSHSKSEPPLPSSSLFSPTKLPPTQTVSSKKPFFITDSPTPQNIKKPLPPPPLSKVPSPKKTPKSAVQPPEKPPSPTPPSPRTQRVTLKKPSPLTDASTKKPKKPTLPPPIKKVPPPKKAPKSPVQPPSPKKRQSSTELPSATKPQSRINIPVPYDSQQPIDIPVTYEDESGGRAASIRNEDGIFAGFDRLFDTLTQSEKDFFAGIGRLFNTLAHDEDAILITVRRHCNGRRAQDADDILAAIDRHFATRAQAKTNLLLTMKRQFSRQDTRGESDYPKFDVSIFSPESPFPTKPKSPVSISIAVNNKSKPAEPAPSVYRKPHCW